MPIPSLPLDIIFEIVSHLEEEDEEKIPQQIEQGKMVSLVCRSWRPLGQGLRWRTVNIEPQQLPSLLDHFVRFPHLAKLVRDYAFDQPPSYRLDNVDTSEIGALAQLPHFITTLVNLEKLFIQCRMGEDVVPISIAASQLIRLNFLVLTELGDFNCSNEFVASFQSGFKNLSILGFTAVTSIQSTLQPGDRDDILQKLRTSHVVVAWNVEPVEASRIAHDFLSIFDLTSLTAAMLINRVACLPVVECLSGFPRLVLLNLKYYFNRTAGQLSRILPILPRFPSLATIKILLNDVEEDGGFDSPVSLSEIIACFSPSLRIFRAEQFVFPDFSQIPIGQAGTRERSVNTRYISARRPRDMAGGGSTELLLWGEEEEGKVHWFREEQGAFAVE